MTDRALEILDRHIADVGKQSDDCKTRGDIETMYKLNTAWHWLNVARLDIAEPDDAGERADAAKEGKNDKG